MDTRLIAKVLPTKKNGKRSIGTGYPVGNDLVLTARHVVVFAERDKTVPITVEWPDFGYTDSHAEIVFDGGAGCDVVVLRCQLPPQVSPPASLLSRYFPGAHDKWEGYGYPRIGKDPDEEGVRDKVSALGVFHPSDLNSHKISLTSESDAIRKEGWCGISGAPVFQGRSLYAVISSTPTNREECFTAVLLPWLLKHDETFCELVAPVEQSKHQQALERQCLLFLESVKGEPLFGVLGGKFVTTGLQVNPENLTGRLVQGVADDPITLLENFRLTIEPLLKITPDAGDNAQKLFCIVLGIHAANNLQSASGCLHELSVKTRAAVEINLAAQYQLPPDLERKTGANINPRDSIGGKYAIEDEFIPEVGWGTQDNVDAIVNVVNTAVNKAHKQVFGAEPETELDAFDLEELNATLLTRRKGEKPQLIRFEVSAGGSNVDSHPLLNDAVCKLLQGTDYLPDLPIVRFGSGTAKNEAKLRAQINEFFRIIEESKA